MSITQHAAPALRFQGCLTASQSANEKYHQKLKQELNKRKADVDALGDIFTLRLDPQKKPYQVDVVCHKEKHEPIEAPNQQPFVYTEPFFSDCKENSTSQWRYELKDNVFTRTFQGDFFISPQKKFLRQESPKKFADRLLHIAQKMKRESEKTASYSAVKENHEGPMRFFQQLSRLLEAQN